MLYQVEFHVRPGLYFTRGPMCWADVLDQVRQHHRRGGLRLRITFADPRFR